MRTPILTSALLGLIQLISPMALTASEGTTHWRTNGLMIEVSVNGG